MSPLKKSVIDSEKNERSKKSTPGKTATELEEIERSQIVTPELWATGKGVRSYLPYAFTEQGIYMLMTVLKGELATKQSKALIRLFKRMKDYIDIDYKSDKEQLFHCGASSKDIGNKITTIMKIEEYGLYTSLIEELLNQ